MRLPARLHPQRVHLGPEAPGKAAGGEGGGEGGGGAAFAAGAQAALELAQLGVRETQIVAPVDGVTPARLKGSHVVLILGT